MLLAVGVEPSVVWRITPLWSVKNFRWPVEEDVGVATIEYDVMGVPATAVYVIEYPLLTAGSLPKRLSTRSADVDDGVVAGAREAKFDGSAA